MNAVRFPSPAKLPIYGRSVKYNPKLQGFNNTKNCIIIQYSIANIRFFSVSECWSGLKIVTGLMYYGDVE